MKKILVTGGAGFIGFHLSKKLLELGYQIVAIDNLNDYYDVSLKEKRITILKEFQNFQFIKMDLVEKEHLYALFEKERFNFVIHLAAQAGVRYSIDHPDCYIQSNIVGFFYILEACRKFPVEKLFFASSSSVYGANQKVPYSTDDKVDHPVSLYAATKKADELIAYSYSHLYQIPMVGLRFFTVYGPMGRPDMAYFSFTKKIMEDKPIQIYNHGDMYRDFTYIDDIVEGIVALLPLSIPQDENQTLFKLYNVGNNHPIKLLDFISEIEKNIGKEAQKEYLPMQKGDVYQTYANIDDLVKDTGFRPKTSIEDGIKKFVSWYQEYYK